MNIGNTFGHEVFGDKARSAKTEVLVFLGFMLTILLLSSTSSAAGINCTTLPQWSDTIPKVNLHHIFCGEINKKKGIAVGYHANPNGEKPSTYVSRDESRDAGPNAQGVREWFVIKLKIGNVTKTKSKSSLFPDHCSQSQIVQSIIYANDHNTGACSVSPWAVCGPSAPITPTDDYCVGSDGSRLTIASSKRQQDKINTGFPLYSD